MMLLYFIGLWWLLGSSPSLCVTLTVISALMLDDTMHVSRDTHCEGEGSGI